MSVQLQDYSRAVWRAESGRMSIRVEDETSIWVEKALYLLNKLEGMLAASKDMKKER